MWIALAQSERRYGAKIIEANDFADQIFRDPVRPAPRLLVEPRWQVEPLQDATSVRDFAEALVTEIDSDLVDDQFKTMAGKLVKKRVKTARWSEKTKRQAEQIYTLLAKFMKEEQRIENMSRALQEMPWFITALYISSLS